MTDWLSATRTSYDRVAESYATIVRDLLTASPHERAALAVFADQAAGGVVADVGCGPGRLTAHLHALGARTIGLDLSPAMIDVARRHHPALPFAVASMTALPLRPGSLSGLVAWYSLIHIPDAALPGVLSHFRRALRPGGRLLLAFHAGEGTRLKTSGYGGHSMHVHVHHRSPERMAAWLDAGGFTVSARTVLTSPESKHGALLHATRLP